MDRYIVVDIETTGLSYKLGHRIIEFAGLELINRKLTGKYIQFYFRPDTNIQIDENAFKIHGINQEFLKNKPSFSQKIDEIMTFIKGSHLIIHNSSF